MAADGAGMASELNKALMEYQEGDYTSACLKTLQVAAEIMGMESVEKMLEMADSSYDLVELYNQENYTKLASEVIKLLPPMTGEPELDAAITLAKMVEWEHIGHAWKAMEDGDWEEVGEELFASFTPESIQRAIHRQTLLAWLPVSAGVTCAGLYYTRRMGHGMKTNFAVCSSTTALMINLGKMYRKEVRNPRKPDPLIVIRDVRIYT